ncbi:MAG: nucleotidyltransferase domain-containing protein [Sulfurovum sp.]
MRLSTFCQNNIKDTFKEVFGDGKIYLFGSRVDDSRRGGDIDLYIDIPNITSLDEIYDKKSQFRLKLYNKIGEQKIDIVVSKDKNRSIEQEIIKTGILL